MDLEILDSKNINKGLHKVIENSNIYICFNKDYLSKTNYLILQQISKVYFDIIYYSDNYITPSSDRIEYWCPDEEFDKMYHVTDKCNNKKYIVLELDKEEPLKILGTTIMLANCLQEQDPLELKANERKEILSDDEIERHDKYISDGYPDKEWICINVLLNKDNPIGKNPYAFITGVTEINSPILCDNMFDTIMIGSNKKKYITFNIEKEELIKVIRDYYENNNTLSKERKVISKKI